MPKGRHCKSRVDRPRQSLMTTLCQEDAPGSFVTCPDTQSYNSGELFRRGDFQSMGHSEEKLEHQDHQKFWMIPPHSGQRPIGKALSDLAQQPVYSTVSDSTRGATSVDRSGSFVGQDSYDIFDQLDQLTISEPLAGKPNADLESGDTWMPPDPNGSGNGVHPWDVRRLSSPIERGGPSQGDAVLLEAMDRQGRPADLWMCTMQQVRTQTPSDDENNGRLLVDSDSEVNVSL
ncbi:hypothetical protein VTJ83DRAFT_6178 [Remersonia thermophila]|uniref:Uncharacterized protein n=1 Tax=Remersonia thermophila TaxID=72144 RepID=A0ABR4DAH9_9PEZI